VAVVVGDHQVVGDVDHDVVQGGLGFRLAVEQEWCRDGPVFRLQVGHHASASTFSAPMRSSAARAALDIRHTITTKACAQWSSPNQKANHRPTTFGL